jgi:metal transporter CNNM
VWFINPTSKRRKPVAELIGEEIYDEFDTEGARHGEVTSYIPPQSVSPGLLPSLKRKVSAPQLSTHPDALRPAPPAPLTQRSSSVSGTPVQRPIAIPAFKGLSFLTGRSRSAPPTPRDGNGGRTPAARPTTTTATTPDTNYEKLKKPEASADTADGDVKPPEIVIAPPPVDMPATPAPAYVPLFPAGTGSPPLPPVVVAPTTATTAIDDPARARQGASAIARSTSPGPSLSEALLRARRPASAHIVGSKGTRFKSNPLGGGGHNNVLRIEEQSVRASEGENAEGGGNKNVAGGGASEGN